MTRLPRTRLAVALLPVFTGCALHSDATHWNGHVGPDGEPVVVCCSTYFGLNLFGVVPLVGQTTMDEMIDETTARIPHDRGHRLRLVETESSNYWYGLPPLSWLFSPVITSVTIEYRPKGSAAQPAR